MSSLKSNAACLVVGIWLASTAAVSSVVAAEPPVTALAFTADGTHCFVGSQAGIDVYQWPSLARLKSLPSRIENVHDFALSDDGDKLLVAGGRPSDTGAVEQFSGTDWMPQAFLNRHSDSIIAVTWLDEFTFATASLDHDVAIWDAKSGERRHRLEGHSRGVSALASLDDGKVLVSGGLDNNVRVWDAESGDLLRSLNNHTRPVHQLAVRPAQEGLPMVASVAEDRTVRFWQPTIGRLVRFAQLDTDPLALAWRPDGSQIAVTTTDGRLLLIDPATTEVVARHPACDGWAYSVAAHPTDGSFVVGGEAGQLVRVKTAR